MKNVLRRADGTLTWKFNHQAVLENYEALVAGIETHQVYHGPTLFLAGENSDYLDEALDPEILSAFPMAQLEVVPDAGHWIHAAQPEFIYKRFRGFALS